MEASRPDETQTGKTLAHYRVFEKLGAGGMGEVYRAHDEQLDRDVAIKVLPPPTFSDPTARARLLREARAAAALNHPHVCTIFEVSEAGGQVYIAMELIAGQPLDRMIPARGMSLNDILRYGLQISDAVAHAHDRGIVHRDLKPANTLVTPSGQVKVLDFGLAKRARYEQLTEARTASQAETEAGPPLGTLPYMSPEQLRGAAADVRSDVWSLGVMLYEMCAGARPFQGLTGFELSSAILNERPAPLPEAVPVDLKALIGRCLEKEPERRYQRTGEVHAALEAIQLGATTRAAWRRRLDRRHWLLLAAAMTTAAALGVSWWAIQRSVPTRRMESLVVLPFNNLSGDPEQEYFVDGMTEAIITDLAKIGGLKVISRNSAMRYKRTDKLLSDIVRELGVEAVVGGSVQRVGNRVRITAQLIHGATDTLLWADSYDRELEDVLFLQRDLARAIAREIHFSLTPENEKALTRSTRMDSEAYNAYLLGRHYWNQRTRESLERAVSYFERAIDQEPTFAQAYAALADTYVIMDIYSGSAPREVHPKGKALALKALEIDPALGEAHAALAWIAFTFDFDWTAAEKEFLQAIHFSPGHATAHHWYSIYLSAMGSFDKAKAEVTRAIDLDPLSPVIFTQMGFPFFSAGENERATEIYRRASAKFPDFRGAHTSLARSLVVSGAYEEAIAEIQLAEPNVTTGLLAMAYGFLGRKRESQQILEKLKARNRESFVYPTEYVYVYIGLGDKQLALDWLERAYDERGIFIAWLKTWPLYNSLRAEPRFKQLLARMQLEK